MLRALPLSAPFVRSQRRAAPRKSSNFGRVITVGICVLGVGVFGGCVQPTNGLDPDTPAELQTKATLRGTAQAVFALAAGEIQTGVPEDGQTLIEATFCAPRDGDHRGFDVVLREQGSSDGNPLVGRTFRTNPSGGFVFEEVRPGSYVIEILRVGFDVPPPQPIVLGPGADVSLDPLCGLNRIAPERPALGPLPAVVDAGNVAAGAPEGALPPVIEILNCTAGVTYVVDQRPEGDTAFDPEELRTVLTPAEGEPCTVGLGFYDSDGGAARTTWRVTATATDGLANASEEVSVFVVRDTLAPAAPTDLVAQVGRDRVFATWDQAPVLGDDNATGWLLSYGLTPRPQDTAAACPYGGPLDDTGDAFDTAGFAVEGRSPLAVSEIGVTLSGILEGTTMYLQVAAKDDAGNLSCWSAPTAVRPDIVAPSIAVKDTQTTAGIVSAAFAPGVAAFARGSSGVVTFGAAGAEQSLQGIVALDVDTVGRTIYVASGPAGMSVASLATDGSLPSSEISGIGDIRSVAARPGLIIAGTDIGLTIFEPDAPEAAETFDPTCRASAVTDLLVDGPVVLALREENGNATLQATHRSELSCSADEVSLTRAPDALALVGNEIWVLTGNTLQAFDFSACRVAPGFDETTCCADTPTNNCLVPSFSTPLQAQAQASSLAVWDDLVLVGVASGSLPSSGVLALQPRASAPPLTVGLAFTGDSDDVVAVEPRNGGFCAFTDANRICFDAVGGPLAETPVRFSLAGRSVEQAQVAEIGVLMFGSGDDGQLSSIVARTFAGTSIADQALPDNAPDPLPAGMSHRLFVANTLDARGRVSTLDSFGRAYLFDPTVGNGELTRIDVQLATQISTGWADAVHPSEAGEIALTDALVDVDSGRLVVFAANGLRADGGCVPSALFTIDLVEEAAGGMHIGAVDVVDLGLRGPPTAITVDNGIAWLASEPYEVVAVNLDNGAVLDERALGGTASCTDGGPVLPAFGVAPVSDFVSHRLISAGAELVDGSVRQLIEIEGEGELVFDDVGTLQAVSTVGRFLALGSASGTVYLYDVSGAATGAHLVPSLSLPTATQVVGINGTRRGIVFADGPGGAVFHVLR